MKSTGRTDRIGRGDPAGRSIVYYVSGHGFGHATRSGEVIRVLQNRRPDIPIHVRSWANPSIFNEMGCRITFHQRRFDIGVIQQDGITMQIPETLKRATAVLDEADLAEPQESEFLRSVQAGCVVSDIPPVALRLAHKAGIPGIAVTNFSWDWIYDGWSAEYPEARPLAERMGRDYTLSDLLLRLPYSGELPAFRNVEDMPMLGRKGRLPVPEVWKRLGLNGDSRPVVLFSFGGMGLKSGDFPELAAIRDYRFVSTFEIRNPAVTLLPELHACHVEYSDLVRAVDVIVTKPGYGIVSECAVNHTRMLYTDRGSFREYDAIMAELPYWNCAAFIDRRKLLAGSCRQELDALMALDPAAVPGAAAAGRAEGAAAAASRILEYFDREKTAR